ncbi:hypothetical protein TNCV_2586661 [Trichonephila clavipes]|nr:hypothetical protein TNCV_2586661 [Trichonephila clavipes]
MCQSVFVIERQFDHPLHIGPIYETPTNINNIKLGFAEDILPEREREIIQLGSMEHNEAPSRREVAEICAILSFVLSVVERNQKVDTEFG